MACCWKSEDEFVISAVDTTILFYANYCDTSKDNLESKTEHDKNHEIKSKWEVFAFQPVSIVEKYLALEMTLWLQWLH